MSVYTNTDAFYSVMQELFDQLATDPQATAQFRRSGMIIRFRCTQPQAELLLDGRNNPIRVAFGPQPGRADLEMALTADLLHDIWLGKVRLRDAFFGGKIKTSGNVFRAMQLADLFRQAETLYPQVLQQMGYGV